MILKADQIAVRLTSTSDEHRDDPLVIVPCQDAEKLTQQGSASVDLRLGTWFATMRQHKISSLDISDQERSEHRIAKLRDEATKAGIPDSFVKIVEAMLPMSVLPSERNLTKMHYVPFGADFILHPHSFVLAVTLEWLRLPRNLAAYVIGKSSWGRRGLIIATAAGVHPGFTGSLTLELSNVGEIPIAIHPGMTICQLFIHQVLSESRETDKSVFSCTRRPILGQISRDGFATKLWLSTQD